MKAAPTKEVTAKITAATPSHMGDSDFFKTTAPLKVQATTKTITGIEPKSIEGRESRRSPVSTEVGQSGPPHKIATFPKDIPGFFNTISIARIIGLFTPTAARTQSLRLSPSPIHFCCSVIAVAFNVTPRKEAKQAPPQKPHSSGAFAVMTTPPSRYTGTPCR
eukprot:gnl/MRDRNA2_/MRDRNA2_369523_c0_seq1.p1 gnl/MRDRNA2_/MRDRNA2_369523_c0~~gnl/MRDRNA2_/MRDRNA2_369523_c0_seq1.p1  ORF type:complete len:163 (-),score=22.30 gnl/MRDRNA2_/MRDRNA2_369523_c0_seq1:61-549(-)